MGKKRKRKHFKKKGRKGRDAKEGKNVEKEDLEAGPSSVVRVARDRNEVSGPERKPEVIILSSLVGWTTLSLLLD